MVLSKEDFDNCIEKSFFTDRNIATNLSPTTLSSNMIPCDKLNEFHYQVSFFLNFFSALLLEIDKKDETDLYNINLLNKIYNELNIYIDNTLAYALSITDANRASSIDKLSSTISTATSDAPSRFTFYFKTFENFSNNPDSNYSKYSGYANSNKYKPIFTTDAVDVSSSYSNNLLLNMIDKDINRTNISSLLSSNNSKLPFYINEFYNQGIVNFKGYLIDKKIQLNTVLFNINIQNTIRTKYLNNSVPDDVVPNSSANPPVARQVGNSLAKALSGSRSAITSINTYCVVDILANIYINITYINNLSSSNFTDTQNTYLLEKNKYINKINYLNNLKEEYIKTQDKLNISLKLYNQQLKNYNKIKYYATFVIIALIIVIILIIGLSVFPIFSKDTLNAIYIVLLILQIVLTFLYYSNFKYVNLYEKFYLTSGGGCSTVSATPISSYSPTNNIHIKNHFQIYSLIIPKITDYNNAINSLNDKLRMSIFTLDSKSFSQDANKYLYNMYLEKKRSVEINKTKLINYFNMIEVIKKQINYLFNVIFAISCFSIIILLGLVIYSSVPQLYIFVIVLCIILIIILMIYFTFAVIQPTRMIVNKNYWANENPSKSSMAKL